MEQLWKSFRHAFWSRPDGLDFFWCLVFGLGALTCGLSPQSALNFAFWFLFAPRVLVFILDLASKCWPQQCEKIAQPFLMACCVGFVLWIAFQVDWRSISQMRPDWKGAGFVLALGAVAVCFFGPLLWLLDHVFKPFARRSGHHLLSALGFIAVCGAWWSSLVFGILALSNHSWR